MRTSALVVNRHALALVVIGLWITKGAYLYLIWRDRSFSLELDEDAIHLGREGLLLWLLSALFVAVQAGMMALWGLRSVKSGFSISPHLSAAILLFSITSVVGYAADGGADFWLYWPLFALPFAFIAATSRASELALFSMRAFGVVILVSIPAYWSAPDQLTMSAGATDLFDFRRLAGLTPHPNAMGATAAFVFICALIIAARKEGLFWMAVGLVGLVLSQSKTALAGLTVVVVADWLTSRFSESAQARAQFFQSVTVVAGALTSPWWVPNASALLLRDATLTGRTEIWEAAVPLWLNRPIVGQGPEAFDSYFRWLTQLNAAESAHNQVLETLVSSGVIGFVGLAFFMTSWAMRIKSTANYARRRLATALLIFVSLRCINEATLKFVSPSIAFIMVFAALVVMLAPDGRSKGSSSTAT